MELPTRQPRLVDAKALSRARARAQLERAGFLHDIARTELQERLLDVNRTFTEPAVVTAFPAVWADMVPGAKIVPPTEMLELEVGAHDLVVHAMALHWAEDPIGQIVQCRRALRPDGLFLGASLGGETLTELRAAMAEAESAVMRGLSPRVAPMAEVRDMGGLLGRAGLNLPVADRLPQTVTYTSVLDLIGDLRAMGETNALVERHRRTPPRALFPAMAAIYADRFPAPGDPARVRATFELIFLTGWAPHEAQPKPLRPGSAKGRLADALNTMEFDEDAHPVLDRHDE